MKISYSKLWHTMLDKRVKKKELEEYAGVTHYAMIQMGKGEPVSLEVLANICEYLKCDLNDVVEVVSDIEKNTTC